MITDRTIPTRRSEFLAGAKDTLPMIIGAIPFGFIFGALAVNNGLTPAATAGMSLFVFAGSSQFIAAGLVKDGAAIAVIVVTTFIVNLRHALYSASLAPYLKHLPQRWLLPLGFMLTDETYAVVIRRLPQFDRTPHQQWYQLGSSLAMYVNWQICTWIGIAAGSAFTGAENWGLDFAMLVTFIGIVVPLLTTRPMILCAVVSSVTAILLDGMPNNLGLLIAAFLGIAAGVWAESATPIAHLSSSAPEGQN